MLRVIGPMLRCFGSVLRDPSVCALLFALLARASSKLLCATSALSEVHTQQTSANL